MNRNKGGVLSERWSLLQGDRVTPLSFETAEQHYQQSSLPPMTQQPVPLGERGNTHRNLSKEPSEHNETAVGMTEDTATVTYNACEQTTNGSVNQRATTTSSTRYQPGDLRCEPTRAQDSDTQSEASTSCETQSLGCETLNTIAPEDSASNCLVSFEHSSPQIDRSVRTPPKHCEELTDSQNHDSEDSGTETVLHCETKPRSIVSSVLSLWRGNPLEHFDPTICLAAYRNTYTSLRAGIKDTTAFECDQKLFETTLKKELGSVLNVNPTSITPQYIQKALKLYTKSKENKQLELLEPDQRAMELQWD